MVWKLQLGVLWVPLSVLHNAALGVRCMISCHHIWKIDVLVTQIRWWKSENAVTVLQRRGVGSKGVASRRRDGSLSACGCSDALPDSRTHPFRSYLGYLVNGNAGRVPCVLDDNSNSSLFEYFFPLNVDEHCQNSQLGVWPGPFLLTPVPEPQGSF